MRLLLATALLLCASAARAQPAFPGGAFGDKEGCRYARTGESTGADTFFLLDAQGVTTAASFCAMKKVVANSASTFTLTLACESEEGAGADEAVEAVRKGGDVTLRFGDGTIWGPLARCR